MAASLSPVAFSAPVAKSVPAEAVAFFGKNCVGCHQGDKPPAGIDLTKLDFAFDDAETFSRWVRVHDAVQGRSMPPGKAKMPDAERNAFTSAVRGALTTHSRQQVAARGRAVLRRLNRYEYEASVRDLLQAPWLQLRDSLPEDGIVSRFNKSGQALDVSHVQMSRYLDTADSALRLVLAASKQATTTQRYYARDQKRLQNRMRYSPFNRHPERASIPILGFEAQPEVLHERAPMTVGPSNPAVRELEGFATPASTYVGNEYHFDQFTVPAGGRYTLRFNAFSIWIHTVHGPLLRSDKVAHWRPDRERTAKGRTTEPLTIYAFRSGGEKRLLGTVDLGPEPAIHTLDVNLLPGEQILPDAARLFRSRPGFVGSPDATAEGMPGVAYRWMEVTGPHKLAEAGMATAGMVEKYFAKDKDVATMLRAFMAEAYRRAPREAEVQRYLKIVRDRQTPAAGKADNTEALLAGYTAVLCSPGFLYLEEEAGVLKPQALAARLSYFLWNAPPDGELRQLATQGRLARSQVLQQQTERLLNSPRSKDFVNAFLDFWLDLRKLGDTTPDQTLYPEYYLDDLMLESAQAETRLFFQHLLQKDLPVANIVDSRFAFVNAHLARHYDLPAAAGSVLRYVELPPNSPRGGLLTQASILKVTANGTTTSPVLRGAWIMERILGETPPPPPPGTPAIEPDTRGATTIRQQLDKHRSIASCAGCHRKIDPPGFALENFDVLGKWRDRYRSIGEGEPVQGLGKNGHAFTFRLSQPVDASNKMADGQAFANIIEFKKLLLQNQRQLARNMVMQFVAYGTGAPVGFGDRDEVERILDAAGKKEAAGQQNYGLRTLLQQTIQSRLFREK